MTSSSSPTPMLLLDACAVLTLYATDHMSDILQFFPGAGLCDVVMAEALFIHRRINNEIAREPLDLKPLRDAGLLAVIQAESEEEFQIFVDFTMDLDDGEAMSAALAMIRKCTLVTDDRKAERLLTNRVKLRSTLSLIHHWHVSANVPVSIIREALIGVDQRGYRPGPLHPYRIWWESMMNETSSRTP